MKRTIIFALLLVASCGGDSNEITMSGAEFYEELFTADCQSGVRCGLLDPSLLETCIDGETLAACASDLEVCAARYAVDADEWDECLRATEDRACASVQAGILPTECVTIEELL